MIPRRSALGLERRRPNKSSSTGSGENILISPPSPPRQTGFPCVTLADRSSLIAEIGACAATTSSFNSSFICKAFATKSWLAGTRAVECQAEFQKYKRNLQIPRRQVFFPLSLKVAELTCSPCNEAHLRGRRNARQERKLGMGTGYLRSARAEVGCLDVCLGW